MNKLSKNQIELLENEKNELENTYGEGPYLDGKRTERIKEINAILYDQVDRTKGNRCLLCGEPRGNPAIAGNCCC